MTWTQVYSPVNGSVFVSALVAAIPVVVLLGLLAFFHVRAHWAALLGLAAAILIAIVGFGMPTKLALAAAADGAAFGFLPIGWIIFGAIFLYDVTVKSGDFEVLKHSIAGLASDRRIQLLLIGFSFGAFIEGAAGFGTPVAITSSLLIMCGFPALEAIVFVLIFNTTPVAFGALGTPVTVLAAVTGLPAHELGQMIGRQLPIMAAILPFYVMALYGGWRSIRSLWPVLTVAGLSFGLAQFGASNYLDYTLTDVFAALTSLAVTLLFLQVWRPAPDPEFVIDHKSAETTNPAFKNVPAWQGWMPWLVVTAVVIAWTYFKVAAMGQHAIPWPNLDKAVSITLYKDKPYAAVWSFQPLATGTAILVSAIIVALFVRISASEFVQCAVRTIRQIWQAVITVMFIVALAYVMNYSGLAYSIGLAVASTGHWFVLFSPFLGWIAVFLSGSDTSGNALFGNLQVVAARQLNLNPLLFAATNSSGGVLGKMISPQNIATGVSVTNLKGKEGAVLARTFVHSIILTLMLVLIVIVQQYVVPGIIPAFVAK